MDSNEKFEEYEDEIWDAGCCPFFLALICSFGLIFVAVDQGTALLWFQFLFIEGALAAATVFFLFVGSLQIRRIMNLRLVYGLVTSISEPTSMVNAASVVGLKVDVFSRHLINLIASEVVDLEIFPEVDAFGPPGKKPPSGGLLSTSVSENAVRQIAYEVNRSTRIRWYALLVQVLGTTITIVIAVFGFLSQFLFTP
ncbi:MAG: hypothetical protein ACFFER_01160 [Candidatus Thorarchaeota archaeon]